MKKFILLLTFLMAIVPTFSQQDSLKQKARELVKEGVVLYKFCRAQKISDDMLKEHLGKDTIRGRSGYFTFFKDSAFHTIYVQKTGGVVKAYCDFKYIGEPAIESAETNYEPRKLTEYESLIYKIYLDAMDKLLDELAFTFSNLSFFNLVVTEKADSFKVYYMLSPIKKETLLLGYDFILTFDKEGEFISKEQLHNGIIPTDYSKKTDETGAEFAFTGHSHLPDKSPYITATDICNFMMYGPRDGSIALFVASENFISVFKYSLFPELVIKPLDDAGDAIDEDALNIIKDKMKKSQK